MPDIQKPFLNVGEPWMLYDTLCVTPQLFGQENNLAGWFTTWLTFSQKETHTFYKLRSEGVAGLQYNNQQSADRMDYGFEAYSFGIAFKAPGPRYLGTLREVPPQTSPIRDLDVLTAQFWESELPNHCAIQLKVNQDIVAEGPVLDFPPGYGPSGGGVGVMVADPQGSAEDPGFANYSATQGEPVFQNRHRFDNPLAIPRDATIEAVLYVSEFARLFMSQWNGPWNYLIPEDAAPIYYYVAPPTRYMIQVSLMGKRYVQQRGQYHV